MRIVKILRDREYAKEKAIYQLVCKVLPYALMVPKIRKGIVRFLSKLNLDMVKMTEADIFWSNRFVDYDFRGLRNSQRFKENEEKYGQVEYYYHEDQKVASVN